ncbi:MAG: hypothetical protein JWR02_874 [Mucilaginibacter sp.]|nr:hypothetical protein [Mucilaginibacter sp.]
MPNYFTASTISELICFAIAAACLITDKSLMWRIMVMYLFVTCVAELIGVYVAGSKQSVNNYWVYNIFLIFESGFTHLMFAFLLNRYINSKPIIIIGFAIFSLIYIYELIDNRAHQLYGFNMNSYKVMSVLFVVYSLYYYYLLLKDDNYIDLKYSAEFWWVAGVLIFYFTDISCTVFYRHLARVRLWNGRHLTHYIISVLNILLYGCWSYSFICRKWLTTTSRA